MTYKVMVVSAMDQNGLIGLNNQLPWHCPVDLRRFRALTMGRCVLMGRKTADSLKKPLRDRVNMVYTRNKHWSRPGFIRVSTDADIKRVLKRFQQQEVWVIGGADLYKKFLPKASVVHLTILNTEVKVTDQDQPVYFPVNGLKRYNGMHAQVSADPNVVFWVFTPQKIQTGRNKPANAIVC